MRRVFFFIIAIVFAISTNAQTLNTDTLSHQRKKVAVVLSGGGAKGMAHIGVLRVLERAGIPIDMICGTSMGSLIGGLYSIGYDSQALDSLVHAQDWNFLLSDKLDRKDQSTSEKEKQETYFFSLPLTKLNKQAFSRNGLIKGQNLANLFSKLTLGYHDSIDFNKLPIPFACVTTDMVKFKEIDFHSGYLATAMRASMSIPAAFTPVRVDSMVLVDGGLRNNYPADMAKKMGADIIIGVSLQKEKEKTVDDFNSPASVISQLIDVNCDNKYKENWAITDIPIRVNTDGYSAASFNLKAIDTLIVRGENAAMEHWDEIIALKKELGLDSAYTPTKTKRYEPLSIGNKIKISSIHFRDIQPEDIQYIRKKFKLNDNDSISITQIEKAITALRGNLFYNDASYQITEKNNGYCLNIDTEGKKASQVSLGVRFDNEEKVALQVNGVFPLHIKVPMTLSVTGRLGKRNTGRVDAIFSPTSFNRFRLSYMYRYVDLNVYNHGDRDYNATFNNHLLELGILNYSSRNFTGDILARYEFYDYSDALTSKDVTSLKNIRNEHFMSYHVRLHYNSQDHEYFTTRGSKFEAEYGLYTDNLYQYKDHNPLSVISASWKTSLPLNSRLTIRPSVYGRSIIGDDIPSILKNYVGGLFFSHYVDQQMPFAGIDNIENVNDTFIAAELNLQQRIMDNNYVMLTLAAGQQGNKFRNLFDDGPIAGGRIGYFYDSIIGPLGAILGYSSRTHNPYLYVNLGFVF